MSTTKKTMQFQLTNDKKPQPLPKSIKRTSKGVLIANLEQKKKTNPNSFTLPQVVHRDSEYYHYMTCLELELNSA